jgi:hypothetical protein
MAKLVNHEYIAVRRRLVKWGLAERLDRAITTRVSKASAIIHARAICGPDLIVRVKRTRGSWAYADRNSVTLSCGKDRSVRLSIVLHECAHILDARKGKLADNSHGESFCRTYARLLREVF